MIIKFLLKIWPALTPIAIYLFWIFIVERIILKKFSKDKTIDGEFQELDKNGNLKKNTGKETGNFSLKNRQFVLVIYLSLIIAIICFLFFAIRVPHIEGGKYIPAEVEDNGNVIPGKIIRN